MVNGSAIMIISRKMEMSPVNIGEFIWKVEGFYDLEITCKPKKESPTVLWNCFAIGSCAAVPNEKNYYHMWKASFGNNDCTEFRFYYDIKRREKAGGSIYTRDEVQVNIVDSFSTDLAESKNSLIEDQSDAAKLKIEEQEIWVSKKVLSDHSPFFKALFKGNFKEGTEGFYELKDLKLQEFMQFLGIIHGHEMGINGKTVERLMYLGDYFKAKSVLQYCGEYLRTAHNKEVPLAEKIQLATRYNLRAAAMDMVEKATIEDLKKLSFSFAFFPVVSSLIYEKIRLVEL
ncbi:hypothetical protein L596_013147 [Steinernema carpocapsae]|uniref:BTB domain-containing protein n=1 Tax=Steinernema carpocapsae TaxID=34508 RepID=A0A4U5NZH2_STECR|nr:hypothetical protein L596_013147 [Steinernema carpocapsae]